MRSSLFVAAAAALLSAPAGLFAQGPPERAGAGAAQAAEARERGPSQAAEAARRGATQAVGARERGPTRAVGTRERGPTQAVGTRERGPTQAHPGRAGQARGVEGGARGLDVARGTPAGAVLDGIFGRGGLLQSLPVSGSVIGF